jgi:hypothetical protein
MGWRYTYFVSRIVLTERRLLIPVSRRYGVSRREKSLISADASLFLWTVRFFICPVYESPKFLSSIGRDAEAVEIIHKVAKRNGKVSSLTLEDLQQAAAPYLTDKERNHDGKLGAVTTKFSTWDLLKHSMDNVRGSNLTALFSTPRLAWNTSLVIFCFAALGLAYPLYNGFLGTLTSLS